MEYAASRPRAVFLGTPSFAAVVLRRLLGADSPVEVVAVVTQPDRPVGRRQTLAPSAVKALALDRGLPVLQPVTLRRSAPVAALRRVRPHLGIVAAYGKILPPEVLDVPPHGHLNVHASLLPRWRGAWPVGAAILAGDAGTGVSIMRLDEGMDTGPVMASRAEPVQPDDTTGSLEARLAALGADLLVATIPGYLDGTVVPRPQDDCAATYCRPVRKADGVIDWTQPAAAIERQVRAMQPWPVASTAFAAKQLQILEAHVAPFDAAAAAAAPGRVVVLGRGPVVATGDGLLALDVVRLEGRTPTPIRAFLSGYRHFIGSRLGVATN